MTTALQFTWYLCECCRINEKPSVWILGLQSRIFRTVPLKTVMITTDSNIPTYFKLHCLMYNVPQMKLNLLKHVKQIRYTYSVFSVKLSIKTTSRICKHKNVRSLITKCILYFGWTHVLLLFEHSMWKVDKCTTVKTHRSF